MSRIVYHPSVLEMMAHYDAELREKVITAVVELEESEEPSEAKIRWIPEVSLGAVEIRVLATDAKELCVFFLRHKPDSLLFYAFERSVGDLHLTDRDIDRAQNNHIQLLDQLEKESR